MPLLGSLSSLVTFWISRIHLFTFTMQSHQEGQDFSHLVLESIEEGGVLDPVSEVCHLGLAAVL